MIIIFGTKGREEEIDSGQFECPACGERTLFKRKRVARYFTLFFIPVFRTRTLGEYIECQACGRTFETGDMG